MRRRYPRTEERLNPEAWAIPYGDLITLLLAFFVVMYAVSSVNEGKYRILSDALNAEFRGQPRSMEPVQVGDKQRGSGADIAISVVQQEMLNEQPRDLLMATGEQFDAQRVAQAAAKTAANLDHVADDIEQAMNNLIRADLLTVKRHGLSVQVEIQADILFGSGAASLSPLALGVLAQLAEAIKPFDNPLRVEGHTDNVPINTPAFPSNWELSAARAASVVHLLTRRGLDPKRLTVIGFGEHQPLQSNATPEGRNANRRVVLVILGTDGLPEGAYGNGGGAKESRSSTDVNSVTASQPSLVTSR
jgi:chemotaxis protein MotB